MAEAASGYYWRRKVARTTDTQCWHDALCQIYISKVSLAIASLGILNPCILLALADLGMNHRASGPSCPHFQTYFPSNPLHLNPNQSFEIHYSSTTPMQPSNLENTTWAPRPSLRLPVAPLDLALLLTCSPVPLLLSEFPTPASHP